MAPSSKSRVKPQSKSKTPAKKTARKPPTKPTHEADEADIEESRPKRRAADKRYDSHALDEDEDVASVRKASRNTGEPPKKGKSSQRATTSENQQSATTPKTRTAPPSGENSPEKKENLQQESDQDELRGKSQVKPRRGRNVKANSRTIASTSKTRVPSHDDGGSYEREGSESEGDISVQEFDSDALDDSDTNVRGKRKRGSNAKSKPNSSKKSSSPRKRQRQNQDDDDDDGELDLKEGQEVVGVVVQAPKTGRVPPGRISQNTLDFLTNLKDPECNDREWFKLHEPVYRLAEQEWKDFIDALTTRLTEVDTQIPPLPPKDVIHRIYRDVRFSNDKTPYKKGLSVSFSRSGRKGIFAGYHVAVKPGDTIIAAGSWCPGRNELATIRANLQRNSRRLRSVISNPEFVRFFGEPRPRKDGGRQNVFGMDDELKVAPKGIDKGHKDIDLLKCRSFAVVHRFTDSEVLDPRFVEMVAEVAEVMRPLVHCLNDMMTVTLESDDEEEENDEDETASVEI